jgi:hypothetical protein
LSWGQRELRRFDPLRLHPFMLLDGSPFQALQIQVPHLRYSIAYYIESSPEGQLALNSQAQRFQSFQNPQLTVPGVIQPELGFANLFREPGGCLSHPALFPACLLQDLLQYLLILFDFRPKPLKKPLSLSSSFQISQMAQQLNRGY